MRILGTKESLNWHPLVNVKPTSFKFGLEILNSSLYLEETLKRKLEHERLNGNLPSIKIARGKKTLAMLNVLLVNAFQSQIGSGWFLMCLTWFGN